jgi:hypothetical protein
MVCSFRGVAKWFLNGFVSDLVDGWGDNERRILKEESVGLEESGSLSIRDIAS